MIRAQLLSRDGQHSVGNDQLVHQWRETPGGFLWLDIQSEVTPDVRALLQSFGCNDLVISDCSRTRHPPKVENFEENCFILFRGIAQLDDALTSGAPAIGNMGWPGIS